MKGAATAANDRVLDLEQAGAGFQAALDIPAGNWTAEITAIAADGTVFTEWRRMIIK
jgi:nitrogen fixation protein FixH